MAAIPRDVQEVLRASMTNYLESDLAFHRLVQELVESGTPLSTTQRAEVEELRQRRDYLLHVRMRDLRNIGWPTPNQIGRQSGAPADPFGRPRPYEPRAPLAR